MRHKERNQGDMTTQIQIQPSGKYHGSVLKRIACPGFTVVCTSLNRGDWSPVHEHEVAFFSAAVRGTCDEVVGKEQRSYIAMTPAFHPAGERHAGRVTSDQVLSLGIEFEPTYLASAIEAVKFRPEPKVFRGLEFSLLTRQVFTALASPGQSSYAELESLVAELLAECSKARSATSKSPPLWLERARELLHDEYSHGLSLESVARSVGIHPIHLAHEFRRLYSRTFGEYLRAIRVEMAARALAKGERPISAVASSAGFYDQAHLTKVFKSYKGMTPRQYRVYHKNQ